MSRSSQATRLLIVLGIFSLAVFFFFNFRYADAASLFKFAEEHERITESNFRQIAFPTPSPSPTPEILHTLVGSYYLTNENIDAKLLLNNKGNEPLVVQPTLYNKQGQELQVAPVTVEPQAFRFIDISDWAALGGPSFTVGNIKLLHYGKDLVLGAQIYLTDHARSLSYEEKLAELGKFDSRIQEAVWWMPSANADVRMVLTNTSDSQISVVGKLGKKPNTASVPRTVDVPAHGTKTINLREDFPGSASFLNSDVVSLSLEHSGGNDALLARVLVYEKLKGYSNVVQFSNPNGGRSSEYQGVGFQIEDIGNISLTPIIVARNVGTATSIVTVNVPYTKANGVQGNISLPPLQLAGGEMRLVNTNKIIQRVAQQQIKVASIEVSYDTAPGSVIVNAHTVSSDRNHVFRVPMWDPMNQRSPTGGYPWRIEGTSVTETYIKNITDVEEDYVAFLLWENGGMYMIGRKSIAPHETVHIDVKELRDQQIPDEQGRTIPQYISSGQLQWTLNRKDSLPDDDARANLSLMGRSEQVDLQNGIVNNYSCQNCCAGNSIGTRISPSSVEIEYGETAQFSAHETQETCYGFPYEYTVGANWTSSNSGMGTISGGSITPQSAGQSTIGASWYTQHYFAGEPCPPGGPFFTFGMMAVSCPNEHRGGPNAKETQNANISTAFLSPACGECEFQGFTTHPPSADLTVKPKVTINVPPTAVDGDTVTFSATVQGGKPTSYQWSFTAPSGSGNNPIVAFNSPSSASTTAKAHWFANPNNDCSASPNSTYTIRLTVSFSDSGAITKSKSFTVQVPWVPGAVTIGTAPVTGGPVIGQNGSGTWFVVSIGTLNITTATTVTMYVPSGSQFYNKTYQHEQVHVSQWAQPNGLLGSNFSNAGLFAAIQGLTDTTEAGLIQQMSAAVQNYVNTQGNIVNGLCNRAEVDAYNVSDSLAPQFIYQRCGATTFPHC